MGLSGQILPNILVNNINRHTYGITEDRPWISQNALNRSHINRSHIHKTNVIDYVLTIIALSVSRRGLYVMYLRMCGDVVSGRWRRAVAQIGKVRWRLKFR